MMNSAKTTRIWRPELSYIFGVTSLMWLIFVAWSSVIHYLISTGFLFPTLDLTAPLAFREATPDLFLDGLLLPWFQFDTIRYLETAIHGYIDITNLAFAPLYPLAVRIFGSLSLGRYFLAAIILSAAFAFMSSWLIYQDVRDHFTDRIARRAVFYFLIFPTAFFLFGGYSEGMFLLFMLLSWRSSSKNRWLASAFWASLAVLTRFQGIGLFVPLVYRWWRSSDRRWSNGGFFLLSIPFAFVAWSLSVHNFLGMPYPWQALELGWKQTMGWPWEGIINNASTIVNLIPIKMPSLFFDLGAAVLFLFLTFKVFRKLPLEYGLLMTVLLFPALMKLTPDGWLISVSRYVLTVWPGFAVLASFGEKRGFNLFWFSVSVLLGLFASALFFSSMWIA